MFLKSRDLTWKGSKKLHQFAKAKMQIVKWWKNLEFTCFFGLWTNLKFLQFAVLQLNKYETAPNFIQLGQNLKSDCLLISVFLPVFAWCDHKIVLFWSAEQYYEHIMQKLVKTQKLTNNPMSIFGLIKERMELSHIPYSFSCMQTLVCFLELYVA